MMNDKMKPFIFSPVSSFENPCLRILLDGLIKTSTDKIVVTDSDFKVLLSNFPIADIGDNAAKKLKLGGIFSSEDKQRTYKIKGRKVIYDITTKKLVEEELNCEIYLFFFKEITEEESYKAKFEKLTNFLRHELSTPLISQILALKLVMKSPKNLFMLPEILYSGETSYRILKNCIEEIDMEEKGLSIFKNSLQLNRLVANILEDCKEFCDPKHTVIETNTVKKSKVYADGKLLKKSIENIIFQINERCQENSKIIMKASRSHNNIRFEILAPFEFEYDDIFNVRDKERLYTKLAHNNGLIIAKKIITAHGGKIYTRKHCNRTSLRIILPN